MLIKKLYINLCIYKIHNLHITFTLIYIVLLKQGSFQNNRNNMLIEITSIRICYTCKILFNRLLQIGTVESVDLIFEEA